MALDKAVHMDISSLEQELNNGADRSYNSIRRLVCVGSASYYSLISDRLVFRWCWWRSFKENEGEEGKERKEKKASNLLAFAQHMVVIKKIRFELIRTVWYHICCRQSALVCMTNNTSRRRYYCFDNCCLQYK